MERADSFGASGGESTTVLLVEDNEVFRETLEFLLDVTPDVQVVGTVGDGNAALEACKAVRPDVVLMDYRLPGTDGVETTAAIRGASPGSSVVVLTAGVEPGEEEALHKAGAVILLTKDSEFDEIVRTIRSIAGLRAGASE